jgi:transposase-like protein
MKIANIKIFDGLKEEEHKHCDSCGRDLPLSAFGKEGGKDGYTRYRCKECEKEAGKLLDKLKKKTPPPPADHKCPICGRTHDEVSKYGGKKKTPWVLDHDHATGQFRGWICHKCNLALGNFNDCIDRLTNAVDYLNKSRIEHEVPE